MLNNELSKNTLLISNPELINEWDYVRNAPLTPDDITDGSGKKVWWKCSRGHEWEARIDSRTRQKTGCPYCSNKKVLSGYNDLATTNPELAEEWHSEKNLELCPSKITVHSNKKVWWKCKLGHEWEASPNTRSRGCGCPYCGNRRVKVGFNDLATTNPELAKEWNSNKNNGISPESVTFGSNKKVWWMCRICGCEWKSTVLNRTRGNGCPDCGKKKQLDSFSSNIVLLRGSLFDKHPELNDDWNFERNKSISPNSVVSGSKKQVWWKCKDCGHEWQASIANRSKGRGCPKCARVNRKLTRRKTEVEKKGSLQFKDPTLAIEWDYKKNAPITPNDVTTGSTTMFWWKCSRGHEWQSTVSNRSRGNGCPYCSNNGSSMPEQGIAYYVSQCCDITQRERINKLEVDVYIPKYKIGIEYDGSYYHKDKRAKDTKKTEALTKSGIYLIRIIESDRNYLSDTFIHFKSDNMGSNYTWALEQLFRLIFERTNDNSFRSIDINIERDRIRIRERFNLVLKENSLAIQYPQIASEWNYDRNGILAPDMFLSGSSTRVWWKCSRGHEWQSIIGNRTSKDNGCPYCGNKKLLKGFNDFATKHPELVSEWNYDKNEGLLPEDILNNTQRKVWWKCSKGHEWRVDVLSRCQGNGCPYCSNKRILAGYNDLITLRPDLLVEWNYNKNTLITPDMVGPGTNKKVWWICDKGHEYESLITNRAKGHACPYCAGFRAIKGETDLATVNPELIKEWDYERNSSLKPDSVTSVSGKKVWWIDSLGHSWKAAISHRQNGTGCPYCSGQRVLVGFNDLATKRPDIAEEWNYEKNRGLTNKLGNDISTPDKVTISSGMKVWWKCCNGHTWQAATHSRVSGNGCPICYGSSPKKVLCIETEIEYNSILEAEKKTGINHGGISCCCRGKQKSAGGYHWKFIGDDK